MLVCIPVLYDRNDASKSGSPRVPVVVFLNPSTSAYSLGGAKDYLFFLRSVLLYWGWLVFSFFADLVFFVVIIVVGRVNGRVARAVLIIVVTARTS